MQKRKIILTIQQNEQTVSGVLTEACIAAVSDQTGLNRTEVLDSIEWLSKLKIVEKEEVVIH